MQYRRVGRSGLKVSEISLGNWLTQGRSVDDATTQQIVKRAFDLGVNFFDTADIYTRGAAETALGKAIKDIRRRDLVIATKCFWPMTDNANDRGLSRKHIIESVHGSLQRLGTDYVDIMQFHRFDPETPVDESIRAVEDLIRQGKVLYWGVSEWEADQIAEAHHIARETHCLAPICDQPLYNMLDRKVEDRILPTCERLGMGLVVFSPLAQGVLTGKYLPGHAAPEGSRGADEAVSAFMKRYLEPEKLERVQKLKAYAEGKGTDLASFSLAWILRQPGVASVIVGATKVSQLENNVKASELSFPAEVWNEAEEILYGPSS
ncbi:MAG: aldo/keto reductase family protein [Armatimonadetes bacterium]|nr:aldo/keto reductase family protein [Armatimonadota bacterium]